MQSWSGQLRQRCVFCAFRSFETDLARFSRRKKYHTSPTLYGVREKERGPRSNRKQSRRPLDTIPGSQDAFHVRDDGGRKKSNPKFTITYTKSRPGSSEPDIEQVEAEVLKQLANLKQTMQTTMVEEESKLSQLMSVDPQQRHWEVFEDDIKLLLRQKKSGKSNLWKPERARLYQELASSAGFAGTSKSEVLLKTLHYALLDQVLSARTTRNGKLAKFADLRYPTEWYFNARKTQREIHLHVGPTNSGKTYNALKRLEEADSGFYAGPLRLLAHEVYSRFRAKGRSCDLVTGDDIRLDEQEECNLTSSTVEMVNVSREVEVAVIDEIQMMANAERGWAWTRAFLGANAKEVHLCGEIRVVPLIRELAASMGDTLHIHKYDRLNPLKAMSRSLRGNLKNLRKGDCVVSFSIMGIHALKKQIEVDTGRRVAIVYGSLPPETRAQQAALFNDPDNDYDYLVASDAIGMGLNLSIKRIIFETVMKFNGKSREKLSISQLKQIAGRAGRYRSAFQATKQAEEGKQNPLQERSSQHDTAATVGLVTCLDERDLEYIQNALTTDAESIKAAGIIPPDELVEEFAARLPKGLPFEYVLQRMCTEASIHPRFSLCDMKDQFSICAAIEDIKGLSIVQRCTFAAAPADYRDVTGRQVLRALARCVAQQKTVTVADLKEIPLESLEVPMSAAREYLASLEVLHKALILYLWLSYRFINVFKDQDMAKYVKDVTEQKINTTLLEYSANPELRRRLRLLKTQNREKSSDAEQPGGVLIKDEPAFEELDESPILPIDWKQNSHLTEPGVEDEPKNQSQMALG